MIQALQQSCLEDHLLDLTPSEVPGEGLLQGVGGAPPCRDRQDSRVPGERGRPGGGGAWQGWCWSQLGQYSWASAGSEPSAWELYLPQRRWYLQPQATPQPQEPGNVWEREDLWAQVSPQASLPFQMQAHPQSPGSPQRQSPTWEPLPVPACRWQGSRPWLALAAHSLVCSQSPA